MLQVPCPFWQLLNFYLPSWTSPRSSHSFSIWNSQSHLRLNTSKNMPSVSNLGFFHVSPAQRMASSPICPGVAAATAKTRQSCPTLCDPIDGSPPGSSVPGILQARTLEWVAISFSNAWKWKVKVKLLSRVRLLATPWTAAYQAPLSMGFSRQEYWSEVPLPSLICPICPGVEIRNLRVILSTNPSLSIHVPTRSVGFCLLIYPFLSFTLWTFYVLCFHRAFACTVRTESPHLSIYFFKEGSHLQ